VEHNLLVIMIQILLVFFIIAIITFFIRLNDTIKLEKRIARYSIKGTRNKIEKSYLDMVVDGYRTFVKKQRKKIMKLFPNLIRRYDKYVTDGEVRAVDYVTHKIVISGVFILLTIIAMVLQGKFITIFQFFVSMILGFYILDIILIIVNIFKKKKIENDMLRAIIIMNNAFKSGKSTIQAVEIASLKLSKPISSEFKRMHQEMKYGLAVEVVFDRFAKRMNLEEAEYLSSSLTILNRTGGNIVNVFNSIEKTLFDKMKLKEDLKNSTTVSNLLVKILLVVPIVIVAAIYLLNPNYFDPFFESTTGYVLMALVILLFIVYAYLLQKIVKVEY